MGLFMPNSTPYADRELVLSKHIEFPRELAYAAWEDLRLSLKWWGSVDHVATHAQIDLRPGGAWSGRFYRVADGTECRCVGIIHDIVPYSRMVYTYAWEERGIRGPDTLVTLSFAEVTPFRTKLTIHQRPFRTREERDSYREAWDQTLDRFAACLAENHGAVAAAGARWAAE
jgi:uncharacterized protein YndB with AHSA1/START domain